MQVRALGQSLERFSLQGFPALTGGTSTASLHQSIPSSPPSSARLGSATPQRGRLRPPKRRKSNNISSRSLANNYLVFDLSGARGVPGSAFEASLSTKLEQSGHNNRTCKHSSRSRSSGSSSHGSSEEDQAGSSWTKVRRSISSERRQSDLTRQRRRSRSSGSNGSAANEGNCSGDDLLEQQKDSSPHVENEEAPLMLSTTDFEGTNTNINPVMEAWSPMPTQQRKSKEASKLFPSVTTAAITSAMSSSNFHDADETSAIYDDVNMSSSVKNTATGVSNHDDNAPSLLATMAVAASSIHALNSDLEVKYSLAFLLGGVKNKCNTTRFVDLPFLVCFRFMNPVVLNFYRCTYLQPRHPQFMLHLM